MAEALMQVQRSDCSHQSQHRRDHLKIEDISYNLGHDNVFDRLFVIACLVRPST